MIDMCIYSVYDCKSEIYQTPVFFINDDIAIRSMSLVMQEMGNHPFNHYPEDFSLVKIGEYDSKVGLVFECDHKIILPSLVSLVKKGVSCEGESPLKAEAEPEA